MRCTIGGTMSKKRHKALVAPRVYNPLEDFDLHPLVSAAALTERVVHPVYLPLVYGTGIYGSDGIARVQWRKVWKRKRGGE